MELTVHLFFLSRAYLLLTIHQASGIYCVFETVPISRKPLLIKANSKSQYCIDCWYYRFFEDMDIQMEEKQFPQAWGKAVKMQPEVSSIVHLLSSIYQLAHATHKN